MGGKRKRICRLCLEATESNFEVIEDITREIFDVLSLKVDLYISDEPVMCEECTENVQRCFDFKSSCMLAEDRIFPFTSDKTDASVDLRKVYFSLYRNLIPKDYNVCRFCIEHVTESRCTSLDMMRETEALAEEMLVRCLPEMNFRVIKDPVICTDCMETLDYYFRFMTKCWDIEEKIDRHIKSIGTASKGPVQLSDVVQFLVRNFLQSDSKPRRVTIIKMEKSLLESGEVQIKEERPINTELQELIINDERTEMNVEEINLSSFHSSRATTNSEFRHASGKMYKCGSCEFQGKYRISLNKHMRVHEEDFRENRENGDVGSSLSIVKTEGEISQQAENDEDYEKEMDEEEVEVKNEDIVEIEEKKLDVKGNSGKVETEERDRFEDAEDLQQQPIFKLTEMDTEIQQMTIYRCKICTFKTRDENNLKLHRKTHKNTSVMAVNENKGANCSLRTKYKSNLKKCVPSDKSNSKMKCDKCEYQTKCKKRFVAHMLVHKNAPEVTMYNCKICPYKAKNKSNLKFHRLAHKNTSEATRYRYKVCPYKTKYKNNLVNHMVADKSTTKVPLYKCEICLFMSKYKSSIIHHSQTHKDVSEVKLYECDTCQFQTKYRSYIKNHMLVHKDASEVKMYNCEICPYNARFKNCLKAHMLVHKNTSEATMYKCEACPYETKYKNNLVSHLVIHKSATEVILYKCEKCPFTSKHKTSLIGHRITHKDASEVKMYKCNNCQFQTKYRNSITSHMLFHKYS